MSKGPLDLVRPAQHDALSDGEDSPISALPQAGSAPFKADEQLGDTPGDDQGSEQPQTAFQRFQASPWFPHVVLLCCQLSFASMHVTSHAALDYIPPTVYSTFRIGMAVPFLFLSAGIQEPTFCTQWSDVPWFVVLGLLGVAVPQCLVYVGNKLAGAAYVGVFTPTVPVYVAILSAILRIERFTALKGVGISFAISGAFVLVHIDKLDVHKANTKGMLALITLNASFAVYLVSLQRYLARRPYSFSFFARASTCGCAAVAIVAAPDFAKVDWGNVPASAWAALAWAGLGTSFLAHSGVSWAVGRCSAVVPSIYSCMQPVLTTSLAAVYLGQKLSERDLGAVGAILAGVLIVIYSKVSEDARRRGERAAEYQLVGLPSKEDDDGVGSRNAGSGNGGSVSRHHEVHVDMPVDCLDTSQQAAARLAVSMSGPAAASEAAAISTTGGGSGSSGNGSQRGTSSPGSMGSTAVPSAGSRPAQQLQPLREHDGDSECP